MFCRCILATDMAKHNEILNNFKSVIKNFDFKNQEHTSLVSIAYLYIILRGKILNINNHTCISY